MPALWTCPECGRSFRTARQWHACTDLDLAGWLAPLSDDVRALAEAVIDVVRATEPAGADAPPLRLHPQRTRLAFITAMTFAGITAGRAHLDLTTIQPTWIDDRRIRRTEAYGPTGFATTTRLRGPSDLDADVRRWIGTARQRGDGRRLVPDEPVDAAPPGVLDVLRVPLRAEVLPHDDHDGGLALAVPGWVGDLLAAAPALEVRLGGAWHPGRLVLPRTVEVHDAEARPSVAAALGLDGGDPVDVTLRAAV